MGDRQRYPIQKSQSTPQDVIVQQLSRNPCGSRSGWCDRQFMMVERAHGSKVFEYSSTVATKHAYGLLRTGEWVAEFADELRVMPVGFTCRFFRCLIMTHQFAVDSLKRSVERVSLPVCGVHYISV